MVAHGTIAFDTLTTSDQVNTGTEKSIDTSYLLNGATKAWAYTNNTGTTINDSFNYSSLGDNATGQQDHNLTNAFSGTNNYAACPVGGSSVNDVLSAAHNSGSYVRVYGYDVGGPAYHDNEVNIQWTGDLA
tara:strand:- start:50 stop:442 length:393 start_codon:yes stop_codon:yes gene_type:complete